MARRDGEHELRLSDRGGGTGWSQPGFRPPYLATIDSAAEVLPTGCSLASLTAAHLA